MSRMKLLLLFCVNLAIRSMSPVNCVSLDINCTSVRKGRPTGKFHVNFYLHTRNGGPSKIEINSELSKNLENFHFKNSDRTTVLIHGFLNDKKTRFIDNFESRLLDKQSQNIITVDWSSAVDTENYLNYFTAANKAGNVAEEIKKLFLKISQIRNKIRSDWGYVHFIGHDVGAHIAGMAARKLRNDGLNINRVTGLDPAYPCFEDANEPTRLQKSDADFVDVIHTNSESGVDANFGIYEPLGHIDFYPNAGRNQPQCYTEQAQLMKNYITLEISRVLRNIVEMNVAKEVKQFMDSKGGITCDHNMATYYFLESLRPDSKSFMGTRAKFLITDTDRRLICENKNFDTQASVPMGIDSELYSGRRGVYFVNIAGNSEVTC